MTEDIEERFRDACNDYLAAAGLADAAQQRADEAISALRVFQRDVDEARDKLLRVVRERDVAAALTDSEGRMHPSPRAQDARNAWLRGGKVTVTRPEDTDYWAAHDGVCPECGKPWREVSEDCPRRVVNWHPLHIINPSQG